MLVEENVHHWGIGGGLKPLLACSVGVDNPVSSTGVLVLALGDSVASPPIGAMEKDLWWLCEYLCRCASTS